MNGNVASIRLLVTHRLSFHLMPKRPASLKNHLFRAITLRLGFKYELLCLPGMSEPLFKLRLRLAVGVLLSGVSEWKLLSESSEDSPYPSEAVFWTDFLVAAAGVLCAPVASEALLLTLSLVRPNTQRAARTVRVRAKTTRRSSKLPP